MTVSRRGLLRAIAAGAASTAAVGSAAGYHENYAGAIETREHYFNSLLKGIELRVRFTPTSYEKTGTVPGMTDDSSPDELVVFVHGFWLDLEASRRVFRTVNDALRDAGYEGELIGYSWGSNIGDWGESLETAARNGSKLGAFLRDYRAASPDTTLRVLAHGFGAKTAAEALTFLANETDASVASVDALGPAIDDDSVATGGSYGPAVASRTGAFRNYYKTDDEFLADYPWHEWDHALGRVGVQGTAPDNYAEFDVTDSVEKHDAFYEYEAGCVRAVVDNWQ